MIRHYLDRALYGPRANNLDAQAQSIFAMAGFHWRQDTPPYCVPEGQDPGGGGVPVIAVRRSSDNQIWPAWQTGFTTPAQWLPAPTLTGSEPWFQVGYHYIRSAWSRKYGLVINGNPGLVPAGHPLAGQIHVCSARHSGWRDSTSQWEPSLGYQFLYMSGSTASNPGYTRAGECLGWDWTRNTDLCIGDEDSVWTLVEPTLADYQNLSRPTLGSQVFQIPWSDRMSGGGGLNLSLQHWGDNGYHKFHVPWTNRWYVVQRTKSNGGFLAPWVWWFKADGSNQYGVITLPPAVLALADPLLSNLCFSVDHRNQRILCLQRNLTVQGLPDTPPANSKAPALLWQCDGNMQNWTNITPANPPSIAATDTARSFTNFGYVGGSMAVIADPMVDGAGVTTIINNVDSSTIKDLQEMMPRHFKMYYVHLPRTYDRELIFTPKSFTMLETNLGMRLFSGKHMRGDFRPSNGRVYVMSGDWECLRGFGYGQDANESASYRTEISSLLPDDDTSWVLEQGTCQISDSNLVPGAMDEWNTVYSPVQNRFFLAATVRDASYYYPRCSNGSVVGGHILWTWHPDTKKWTPLAGNVTGSYIASYSGSPPENRKNKGAYDPVTNRAFMIFYLEGGILLHVIDCGSLNEGAGTVGVQHWKLTSTTNAGPGWVDGINETRLTDGIFSALDPVTGYYYYCDYLTGALFYVDTRAGQKPNGDAWLYYLGDFPECKTHTENQMMLHWLDDRLIIFQKNKHEFCRVYTYKPGVDAFPVEHPVPWLMRMNSTWMYEAGGKKKIVGWGFNADPYLNAYKNYWTVEFA